jgi:hypothetical protein
LRRFCARVSVSAQLVAPRAAARLVVRGPTSSVRATASAVSSQLRPRGLFVPVLPQLCRRAGRGCSSGRGLGTSLCSLERSNPIVLPSRAAGRRAREAFQHGDARGLVRVAAHLAER